MTTKRSDLLERYFYLWMSLLIVAVVVYGFSFTIGRNLIHPAIPRPSLLYFHATVFSLWLVFLISQSALIRTHNVALHRRVGWFGVALGAAIPLVGVSIAITMSRFNALKLHQANTEADLVVPLFDMVAFSIPFALAVYWRKKPEIHRRLILVATCALTAAAFGRFPGNLLPPVFFYAGVDLLILLGAVRDLVVMRSIHPVYCYALPAFIAGQVVVMYTNTHHSPLWIKIAHAILS
ncbi:MAG: hypothetical protein DMG36_19535 [Acidobacteria bacterium]|nr:MAG: hypothetical protein DMG36_19535 [Acidobacteriota bacterium]